MKTYGRVEIKCHKFLTRVTDKEEQSQTASPLEQGPQVLIEHKTEWPP